MQPDKFKPAQTATVPSVRKAAEAIAINPQSGQVTLLTRKLFNVLLYHAQRQGEGLAVYRASLKDIVNDASFDSHDTALIKDHLRKMNQIQVEWNATSQDGNRRWGVTHLVAEAEVIEDRQAKTTWVEWSYSPKIQKQLLQPEVYARLSLQFQASLRSAIALALYEICYRYARSPSNLTMRHAWEWWRPVLTGTPGGGNYPEYKYFKRDVIKGAIAEVNAITDIEVELIEHKVGRKVVEIQFRSTRKAQEGLLLQPALFDMRVVSRMKALGLSQREVEQIYGETEEPLLRAVLDTAEARQANTALSPLANPAAWFKAALTSGRTKVPVARKPAVDKPKLTRDAVRERYLSTQRGNARGLFGELSEEPRAEALAQFRRDPAVASNPVLLQELDRKGLESKIAEQSFFAWFAEKTWGTPTESDLLDFALGLHGEA